MLDVIDHGRVRELRLARPPANALDGALIAALRSAVRDAQPRPDEAPGTADALVLSGAPGKFTGGLDVPALLRLDRDGVRGVWQGFLALSRELATSDVPIGAALTGHSPAAGMVMALFADYRILAEGPYVLGMNEVQVGLAVPAFLLRSLGYVVGSRQAERLAVAGLLVPPAEALRIGLVDELAPLDEVVPRTVAWAERLLACPRGAMRDTRRTARAPLHAAFDDLDENALAEKIVTRWFSDETQSTLRGLAARLGKANTPRT